MFLCWRHRSFYLGDLVIAQLFKAGTNFCHWRHCPKIWLLCARLAPFVLCLGDGRFGVVIWHGTVFSGLWQVLLGLLRRHYGIGGCSFNIWNFHGATFDSESVFADCDDGLFLPSRMGHRDV